MTTRPLTPLREPTGRLQSLLPAGALVSAGNAGERASGQTPPPARATSASLRAVSDEDTFDLAAAGLRGDGAELSSSVEVLARKLEEALPGRVRVERSGGGLLGRGAKHVRAVRVELGSNHYELTVAGERVDGYRERQVGGIAIKREPLHADEWIAALTADLQDEAQSSAQARAALERLLA